jgi:hypothetical protein
MQLVRDMRNKHKIFGGSLKGKEVCVRNFDVHIKETGSGVQTAPVAGSVNMVMILHVP